jgi:hypothetical protein
MLSLLLLAGSLQSFATSKGHKIKKKAVEKTMTVAGFPPSEAKDAGKYVTVSFNESARFYRLSVKSDPAYMKLLKESERDHTSVVVKRADEKSDIILNVKKAK